MNNERTHYRPGGRQPFFFYALFGPSFADLQVTEHRHRVTGIPGGIQFLTYDIRRDSETMTLYYSNQLGELLREKGDELFRRVALSPACLVIVGEVSEDTGSLEYFRNMIGIVQAAVEQGAVAVLDAQTLRWYSAEEWSETFFAQSAIRPLDQTALLVTKEGEDVYKLHTRGMRKFGRPDLSIRQVPESGIPYATSLVNRLIELQADGERLQAASFVTWRETDWSLVGTYNGDVANPEFNNESVEYDYNPAWGKLDRNAEGAGWQ
ncbi:hypothetical protein ACFFK0_29985 [Paenibacillus chartarius]|uniref:Uncharacterized protein n=1 Tax=Paenibacillus chartarius TaxID=747481 RepID=A0ABV6DVF5_9BACL